MLLAVLVLLAADAGIPDWASTAGVVAVLGFVLWMVVFSGKLRPEREVLKAEAETAVWKAAAETNEQRCAVLESVVTHIINSGVEKVDLVKTLKEAAAGKSTP